MNDETAWKLASKGARLNYKEIIRAAHGEAVTFNNMVPTFSVSKKDPTFVTRIITATADYITRVPRDDDPLFVT